MCAAETPYLLPESKPRFLIHTRCYCLSSSPDSWWQSLYTHDSILLTDQIVLNNVHPQEPQIFHILLTQFA